MYASYLYVCTHVCIQMSKKKTYTMHISISKTGRTTAPIPADIRDELELKNSDIIEVKRSRGNIVIVPKKRSDIK